MALPSFLENFSSSRTFSTNLPYVEAQRRSKILNLSSHALWWPSRTDDTSTIIIMVPGNPGLAHFYAPFLTAVHDKCNGVLPIVACGLVGHTSGIDDKRPFDDPSSVCLSAQVEHLVDLVDAAGSIYNNIVIMGHSIGSWLSLQLLKARPNLVGYTFLLFPTIAHIASTPAGQTLSWLFRPPLPRLISMTACALRFIPGSVLASLFPDWPLPQVMVLHSLIGSPSAVYSTLTMAHDEMKTLKEPDVPLLRAFSKRIHLYFAPEDRWVGEQKALLLKELELYDVKVTHGPDDIPHAFVINHGEPVASQCFQWLRDTQLV
ncbi:hypothetical protein BXZ70DRAFT_974301 [Cristinia sonorae]|uniref:Lipid droplet-associated hydrolase n=1 Tax=Cristinia sonorae TaxID=1940300 RepID=A0A8K0XPC3_9AGAR|nr:hypothetical protein BXZ70DRAFT_974301 [Cristinia sonorae]